MFRLSNSGVLAIAILLLARSAAGQFVAGPPAGVATSQRVPELASNLLNDSRQLVNDVRYELYGTNQGRQLDMRANAVAGAALQVWKHSQNSGPGDIPLPRMMEQFDLAFREFCDVFRNSGAGVADRTAGAVIGRRIGALARGRVGPNFARFQNLANMITQLNSMLP